MDLKEVPTNDLVNALFARYNGCIILITDPRFAAEIPPIWNGDMYLNLGKMETAKYFMLVNAFNPEKVTHLSRVYEGYEPNKEASSVD